MNRKGFTKMNDKINNELSFDFFKPEKIIVNNVITTTFTFALFFLNKRINSQTL